MNQEFKEIDEQTLDDFVFSHPKEHFMQTAEWGKIKSMQGAWKAKNTGYYEDGILKATAMLLLRKIPFFGLNICYAPRGFMIDYEDMNLVKRYTAELVKWAKKQKVCYIMCDPDVYFCAKDKNGHVVEEHPDFVKQMEEIGYVHQGFNQGFEKTQPRYTYRLDLQRPSDEITAGFSKIIRTQMKNTQEYGIECEIAENIDLFYEILADTAQRNHFIESPKKYYQDIYDLFKEKGMARCYTAKYYPMRHLAYLKNKQSELMKEDEQLIEKLKEYPNQKVSLNRRKQIATQMEKLSKTILKTEEMLKEYPDGVVLSSGITLCTKHRAWLVYGGNRTILREAGANYAIKQFEIFDDKEKGYEFVDFFGTCSDECTDSALTGIHDFKKKFGSTYIEFPGEFHYVLHPVIYHFWIRLYPWALKTIKKLRNRTRKH